MNKKLMKHISIYGFVLVTLMFVLELIILNTCNSNFGCLVLGLIPPFPGMIIDEIIGLNTSYSISLFSAIFYFLFGSLIGWIVWKIKNKQ